MLGLGLRQGGRHAEPLLIWMGGPPRRTLATPHVAWGVSEHSISRTYCFWASLSHEHDEPRRSTGALSSTAGVHNSVDLSWRHCWHFDVDVARSQPYRKTSTTRYFVPLTRLIHRAT